jgi:hypothetical protein
MPLFIKFEIVQFLDSDRRLSLNTLAWIFLLLALLFSCPSTIAQPHGLTWAKVLCLIPWGMISFLLAKRVGYPAWVAWPVALAGILVVQYLAVTPPTVRQHDVDGHREYVDYLISTGTLPAVRSGWETWQPPLYYGLAAIWRGLLSGFSFDDPFRPVQFLAAILFLATLMLALYAFWRLQLNSIEAIGGLAVLTFLPGYLFFAGRINNDVLLPILGTGIMLVVVEYVRSAERRWLWWLAGLLLASLATKGSSLAIVGGALMVVFYTELRRSGWRQAIRIVYLTGFPASVWIWFWWMRNYDQTGNPLYVNAALPDNLRIASPFCQRLLSFNLEAFLHGDYYYDQSMRQSYPAALVTSLLYGEYGMTHYQFRWSALLRSGCLGLLLVLLVGALKRPRPELRPVWATCLCLMICQAGITVAYAMQYPFACNQNMRFFAQAFGPIACLWGLGVGHFWRSSCYAGRCALAIIGGAFFLGLIDFYERLLL